MASERERGRPAYPDVLTPGEWRVVEAVRHGLRNREIAQRQGVSIDAVKYHVANAFTSWALLAVTNFVAGTACAGTAGFIRWRPPMEQNLKLGALGQVARTVKDIAAARAWYADVLGLAHLYSFGNLAFFDCSGVRLFLSEGDGKAAESILYFRVEDVRTAHEALAARGVSFTHAPHMIHRHADGQEEWMAFFTDNEGRPLAIMSTAR